MKLIGALILALTFFLPIRAGAGSFRSLYTEIGEKACKPGKKNRQGDPPWSDKICEGVGPYRVHVSDDDNRQDLSLEYRKSSDSPVSLNLGLVGSGFRHLGKKIEWRIPESGQLPSALIVRVHQDENGAGEPFHQYLVVAKLDTRNACIVKIVDTSHAANANELARTAADAAKRDTPCLKP